MATVTGTNGNDSSLGGTPDNDMINGLRGDDWLASYGGADTLDGGLGKDIASYYNSPAGGDHRSLGHAHISRIFLQNL